MGKCYWFVSASSLFFSSPCFLFISPFLLLLPCLVACFVVYVLAILFCWLLRVNGKRSCLCRLFGFNKKKEEAIYVFGHAFFRFLWEVGLTVVESCWWSFWVRKGFCLWSYRGLEQWYFLYLLCYFFFFSISFVYIELCLRTANAIAHCI